MSRTIIDGYAFNILKRTKKGLRPLYLLHRLPPFLAHADPPVSFFDAAVNRNKRNITLDLKQPAGREIFLELARSADVVVQNYRPGRMAELGCGYEQVRAVKAGIVSSAIGQAIARRMALRDTMSHGGKVPIASMPISPLFDSTDFVVSLGGYLSCLPCLPAVFRLLSGNLDHGLSAVAGGLICLCFRPSCIIFRINSPGNDPNCARVFVLRFRIGDTALAVVAAISYCQFGGRLWPCAVHVAEGLQSIYRCASNQPTVANPTCLEGNSTGRDKGKRAFFEDGDPGRAVGC